MTYQLVPSEINFIQLLDGSIPSKANVAAVVVLSDIILDPPAEIVTLTLATFLMVYSLPLPAAEAVGNVIV